MQLRTSRRTTVLRPVSHTALARQLDPISKSTTVKRGLTQTSLGTMHAKNELPRVEER